MRIHTGIPRKVTLAWTIALYSTDQNILEDAGTAELLAMHDLAFESEDSGVLYLMLPLISGASDDQILTALTPDQQQYIQANVDLWPSRRVADRWLIELEAMLEMVSDDEEMKEDVAMAYVKMRDIRAMVVEENWYLTMVVLDA